MGIVLLACSSLFAQNKVGASGGDLKNGEESMSFTVGQVFHPTTALEDISLNPSIQIPFEINVVLSLLKEEENFFISAYPNPSNGELSLSLDKDDLSNLEYVVTDMYGVSVAFGEISTSKTEIDLSTIDVGAYILSIKKGITELKNIKIVKQ